LFIVGNSESVGNTEEFDYEEPFDVGEDVIYASAGSEYTLVVLDNEKAAVAGYIEKITEYSGYFGLPQQDLLEGSNELAIVESVVNLQGDLLSAPNFKKVYAGVKTNDGEIHSVFIDVDGNVYAAGSNKSGQLCIGDLDDRDIPHQIDLGEDAVSVAVGGDFTLILGASGDVYGCGSNEFGQLGLGAVQFVDLPNSGNGLKDVKSVSAGLDFSLLITQEGLVVMGNNSEQQFCTDELDEVREPYFLGSLGSSSIRQFRAGLQSSYVLFVDGSVVACGLNTFGQLGIGKIGNPGPERVLIPGENFIKTLGVGPSAVSAFFVASDGVIYGTGRNNRGQLGVGDIDDRDSPDPVLFEFNSDDVARVSAAFDHTLAW
jgi:alpha-tubulin suppressor-like RCC1 family protein